MFNTDNLKKGQAADMITRLKHGAHVSLVHVNCWSPFDLHFQTHYIKKVKVMGKIAKVEEKERQRRARETVSEGPLTFDEEDFVPK